MGFPSRVKLNDLPDELFTKRLAGSSPVMPARFLCVLRASSRAVVDLSTELLSVFASEGFSFTSCGAFVWKQLRFSSFPEPPASDVPIVFRLRLAIVSDGT